MSILREYDDGHILRESDYESDVSEGDEEEDNEEEQGDDSFGDEEEEAAQGYHGCPSLLGAAEIGDLGAVEAALVRGADIINSTDAQGRTAVLRTSRSRFAPSELPGPASRSTIAYVGEAEHTDEPLSILRENDDSNSDGHILRESDYESDISEGDEEEDNEEEQGDDSFGDEEEEGGGGGQGGGGGGGGSQGGGGGGSQGGGGGGGQGDCGGGGHGCGVGGGQGAAGGVHLPSVSGATPPDSTGEAAGGGTEGPEGATPAMGECSISLPLCPS